MNPMEERADRDNYEIQDEPTYEDRLELRAIAAECFDEDKECRAVRNLQAAIAAQEKINRELDAQSELIFIEATKATIQLPWHDLRCADRLRNIVWICLAFALGCVLGGMFCVWQGL